METAPILREDRTLTAHIHAKRDKELLLSSTSFITQNYFILSSMNEVSISELAAGRGQNSSDATFLLWILENTVKPKFSISQPATITPQGRAVLRPVQQPAHQSLDDGNKPWRNQMVIDAFEHVVKIAEVGFPTSLENGA